MRIPCARPVLLTAAERERLKKMAYGHKTEYRLRRRAQVALHAALGRSNALIARETGLHLDTVRTWRDRFAAGGLPALADRKRSGRPARFTPVQVRWPVSDPPRPAYRGRAGRARSWLPS
jgi:DNA-binding CsgD family transcriptional regulator